MRIARAGVCGGWSAIATGILYVFFRWLGAREARRRQAELDNASD